MVQRCVVQNCKTRRGTEKHSLFCVPRDNDRRKRWQKNISVSLKDNDVVCDKHFQPECVLRSWVHKDCNGKIIANVPYKTPRLTEHAVPTIFLNKLHERATSDSPEDYNCAQLIEREDCSERMETETTSEMTNPKTSVPEPISNRTVPTMFLNKLHERATSDSPEDYNAQLIEREHCSERMEMETTSQSNPKSPVPMLIRNRNDSTITCPVEGSSSSVFTTVNIENKETDTTDAAYRKYFSLLPKTWSVCKLPVGEIFQFVFSHTIIGINNGVHVPITKKSVTLDRDKNLQYFVYGRRIDTHQTGCIQILTTDESLPDILEIFELMNICSGIGDVGKLSVPEESAFRDNIQQWRDNSCSMIWRKNRCEACMKRRKRVLQQALRARTRQKLGLRLSSNDSYPLKLTAMRKKYLREKQRKDRAKKKVQELMTTVKEQKEKLSKVRLETLEEKCSEYPEAQKLVLKEIVAAASKKDARGRRYTEEWMMLCMLLNIRSRTNYNLLRANEILPLPSSRTIRRYLSLVSTTCGFDNQHTD